MYIFFKQAEKDIRSAVDLLKEVASAVTILKLGSAEEQQYYVSTWSKILSVCAQELKHGALIWKQSLQKNVQSQILSEPQGICTLMIMADPFLHSLTLIFYFQKNKG